MKKLISLFLLLLMGAPAMAGYSRPGGVKERVCYKEVYREEYIPGTRNNPGRVRRWTQTKEVPCRGGGRRNNGNRGNRHHHSPSHHVDNNSCIEGAIIGGILGGGTGAVLSQGDGRWWAVPLGVAGGSMIGCQIDGG